ncbi:MAG: hypothetical protein WBA84_09955 [Carnobacterium sp.]|uniref:hypothetical protein n=1 Tax=Carnobacterium sp. TaxID=48221 RepID=UPI003C780E3F
MDKLKSIIDEAVKDLTENANLKYEMLIFRNFNIVSRDEFGILTKEFLEIAPMLVSDTKMYNVKADNGIISTYWEVEFTGDSINEVKEYLLNKEP